MRINKISSSEENNLVTDEKTLAKTFNVFLVNVVISLGIIHESNILNDDKGHCNVDEFP